MAKGVTRPCLVPTGEERASVTGWMIEPRRCRIRSAANSQ
jgi:hypothetical protein